MKIQTAIESIIKQKFDAQYLSLENESYMHNVPEGSESHFKLVLVCDAFHGKRLVQRHQSIYGALSDIMDKIHALALHLYSPQEWEQNHSSAPSSPKCHGGE
ncbi:BolA/IbaG family iron-sulfur metabolism protein [Marinomonas sp.]|nr:BolA/IbaG family iron-sulfur metabolism protein [Marinomonas sp.]MDB4837061.1 BolA/IbaG family iron-sulfur metabolism protein [Marinomonas sp.]